MTRDLRPFYTAPTEHAAAARFEELAATWGGQYPAIIALWRNAWSEFIPFLDYGACCKIGASRELIFPNGEDVRRGARVPSRAAGPGVLVAAGHARVAA
jgi:hypothetical protein